MTDHFRNEVQKLGNEIDKEPFKTHLKEIHELATAYPDRFEEALELARKEIRNERRYDA